MNFSEDKAQRFKLIEIGRKSKSEILYVGVHENDTDIEKSWFCNFQDEGVKVRKDV